MSSGSFGKKSEIHTSLWNNVIFSFISTYIHTGKPSESRPVWSCKEKFLVDCTLLVVRPENTWECRQVHTVMLKTVMLINNLQAMPIAWYALYFHRKDGIYWTEKNAMHNRTISEVAETFFLIRTHQFYCTTERWTSREVPLEHFLSWNQTISQNTIKCTSSLVHCTYMYWQKRSYYSNEQSLERYLSA